MKVSREQMARNRSRILMEAGRLFREKGFDAVSVAEVMKAAGLTHGGFYGHFASKDDLIAQTLAEALGETASSGGDLSAWLDSYLSPRHRDNPAHGCPTAGLAADVRHQGGAARAALGLPLTLTGFRRSEAALSELPELTVDRALLLRVAAARGSGLLALAPEVVQAVTEARALGRVGRAAPAPRRPT